MTPLDSASPVRARLSALDAAIAELGAALRPHEGGMEEYRWKSQLRRRLAAVRESLNASPPLATEAWLAERSECAERMRRRLLMRVSVLGSGVIDRLGAEAARAELERLVVDLQHYVQRTHDLFYDTVSLELGGSE